MGARYAGVHLEGPYLSKAMHGLLDANQLQEIDLNELDTFLSEYHEDIRVMTIAPGIDKCHGSDTFIASIWCSSINRSQ